MAVWPGPESGGEWSYIQVVADHERASPERNVEAGSVLTSCIYNLDEGTEWILRQSADYTKLGGSAVLPDGAEMECGKALQ